MAQDVIITPVDGEIEWQDNTTGVALIDIDANNNLSITNAGGNLSIGDGSSDVYIGNGIANVDLVFEQDGEIRGTGSQTLTLGTSGDTVQVGTGVDFLINGSLGIGATPTAPLTIRSTTIPQVVMGYPTGTNEHRFYWDSSKVFLSADHNNNVSNSGMLFSIDGSTFLQGASNGDVTVSNKLGVGVSPVELLTLKGQGHSVPTFAIQRSGSATTQFRITAAESSAATTTRGTSTGQWANVLDSNNSNLFLTSYAAGGTGGSIILDADKVGVGGTPTYEFDCISANARITATSTAGVVNHLQADNIGAYVGPLSNHSLFFKTNNTTKMTILSNGSVGIGISPSGSKVHINNGVGNGSGVCLYVDGSGDIRSNSGGSLFFGAYDYAGSTYIRGYDTSSGLYFYVDGTHRVHMTNSTYALKALGATFLNSGASVWNKIGNNEIDFARETNFGYSSSYRILQLGTSGATRGISIGVDVSGNASGSFGGDEIIFPNQTEIITPNAANNGYLALIATDASNKVRIGNYRWNILNDTPGITIDTSASTNHVGIGTTSPSVALDVVGSFKTSSTATLGDDLLIGPTTTPDIVLQSSGSGVDTNGKLYWKDSGGTVRASAGYETGSTEFFIDNTFSGGLYLKSNGTIGLTLNSAANVGIGTTSPTDKLHVVGNLKIAGNINPAADATYSIGTSSLRWLATYTAKLLAGDGSATAPGITFINDTDTGLFRNSSDYLNISAGGTEIVSFNSNGLNFASNINGSVYVPIEGGSGAGRYWLMFDYTNNASYPFLTNRTPSGKVVIKTGVAAGGGENTHFTIEGGDGTVNAYFENANVGIGTTSPAQKLNITDGGILMTDENSGQPMFQARNYATSATGTFDNTYGFEYRHASSGSQTHGALIHLNENNISRRTLTVSSGLGTIAQFTSSFHVGIATANPKARMQVVTTSDTSGTPTTYDDNGKYFTVGQGGETGGNVFISYDNTNNRGYIGALSPSVAWRNLILNPGGGNVGIGTTSPYSKLQVNGATQTFNAHFGQGQNNSSGHWGGISLGYSENNNNYRKVGIVAKAIGDNAARQELHFLVDSVNDAANATLTDSKMMIDISGNVGIGTTDPSQKLHVYNGRIAVTDGYNIGDADANTGMFVSSDYFYVQTAGTTRMTVADNGKVGIGTTSPSYKLDVSGDVRVNGSTSAIDANYGVFLGTYSGGTSISPGELVLATQGKTGWGPGDELGRIRFWLGDGSGVGRRDVAKIIAVNESGNGSTTTTAGGALAFYTSSYNTNVAERVRIKQDGNVGIGITNPGSILDVNDSVDGGALELILNNSAAVGSTDEFTNIRFRHAGKTGAFIKVGREADLSTTANTDNFMALWTTENDSPSEKLRITSTGNVGIGTTDPSTAKLYVLGGASSQTFSTGADELVVEGSDHAGISILAAAAKRAQLYFNTDAFLRWVDNDGVLSIDTSSSSSKIAIGPSGANVGIGTTSPSKKLHVNGEGYVYGKLTIGNNFSNVPGSTDDYVLNIIVGSTSTPELNSIKFIENTGGFGMAFGYDGTGSGDDNKLVWYNSSKGLMMSASNGTSRGSELGLNGNYTAYRILTINNVSAASRPAIKIVNPNVDASTASNGRTFNGWLPIDLNGTTKWIPTYN